MVLCWMLLFLSLNIVVTGRKCVAAVSIIYRTTRRTRTRQRNHLLNLRVRKLKNNGTPRRLPFCFYGSQSVSPSLAPSFPLNFVIFRKTCFPSCWRFLIDKSDAAASMMVTCWLMPSALVASCAISSRQTRLLLRDETVGSLE